MKDILLAIASGFLGAGIYALWQVNKTLNDYFDELTSNHNDEESCSAKEELESGGGESFENFEDLMAKLKNE